MKRKNKFLGFFSMFSKSNRRKNKKNKKANDTVLEESYKTVACEFETYEDMEGACSSGLFDVMATFEQNGKPVLMIKKDGWEQYLDCFGGTIIGGSFSPQEESLKEVETMYFEFEDEEYLKLFWVQLAKIYPTNLKIPVLASESGIYVDLERVDKDISFRVTGLAMEYMGKQVTDVKLAKRLEKYFSNI